MQTRIPKLNRPWPKNAPWATEEECLADLTKAWNELKTFGVANGLLEQRADGTVVGRGHPNKLFDAFDKANK